jgi:hypothetical protein
MASRRTEVSSEVGGMLSGELRLLGLVVIASGEGFERLVTSARERARAARILVNSQLEVRYFDKGFDGNPLATGTKRKAANEPQTALLDLGA